jgi:hypothetical protein
LLYLVLKGCLAAGERRVAGDVVGGLGEDEARDLVNMGRLSVVDDPIEPMETNRSVGLSKSEAPTPRRRGRARDAN